MSTGSTVGEVLEARLRQLGVGRVYGHPLAGLDHVDVEDPDVAVLLADVDGRIGHIDGSGRLGAALVDGPILHLSSCPGGTAPLQTVSTLDEVLAALADSPGLDVPATTALHLDLDLDAPTPSGPSDAAGPLRTPVLTLDPALAGLDIVVLVGPGIVRTNTVDWVHSFSRSTGAGVVATWGARGVERRDSPFNFGVVGLQARDLELAGVAEADLVVTSGLDPDELGIADLSHLVVQEVPPRQLGVFARDWSTQPWPTEPTRLVTELAAFLSPLYESETIPLTAPRAALHLAGALPDGGLAVVDPGEAGFWVARSFPTSVAGSLCVPAIAEPGFAAAAALVCRLENRPVLAVTDEHQLELAATEAVVELADRLGSGIALQVWGDHGSMASTRDHVDLLAAHLVPTPGSRLDPVPIDVSATAGLVDLAGAVRPWT